MKRFLILVLCSVTIAFSAQATVQMPRWVEAVIRWVDEADSLGCDTSYVRLPEEGFIAYVNHLSTGTLAHATYQHPDGAEASGRLSTATSSALSLSLAYRGWGVSYTLHRDAQWSDDDFSFTFNSRRYGLDYRYHLAHSLAAADAGQIPICEGDGRMRTTSFTGYWVFQHERYSHPGATIHTTYQLRSAGSWLGAVGYWHGSYNDRTGHTLGELPSPTEWQSCGLPNGVERLSFSHLNVGGGYGYNLVFAHTHCMLSGIFIPMVNVWHRNRCYALSTDATVESYISETSTPSRLSQNFAIDAVSRLGFVYNHSRFLTGFQCVFNYSFLPCEDVLTVHGLDFSSRFFVGVRF